MNDRNSGGRWILFLLVAVIAVWFFWPSIQSARQSAAFTVPQQVQQVQPSQMYVPAQDSPSIMERVVEVVVTAVPQAQPAPAEPVIVATMQPVIINEVQPEIIQQPEAAATAGAGLVRITAAGKTYELTGEKLVDCINAQENGQRTGPTCPPNAKQYAGMLGQGR
jgi:hypothetical protein